MNKIDIDDPLYDDEQTAKYLGLRNRKTLAVWRCRQRNKTNKRNYPQPVPTYVGSSVRYRKSALEKFIAERTL